VFMVKHKILIIKTGYSEMLEGHNNTRTASLGDVLRVTPLLHLFKDDDVTWVTDKKVLPLLVGNPYISRILILDFLTIKQLEREKFDTLINLEKDPGICALADQISAWRKFGFRFDSMKGVAEAYDNAFEVLALVSKPNIKKENQRTSQDLLFDMVGATWNKEEHILGYKPKTSEEYDIGLNTQIGPKWPTKFWPIEYWDKLETDLIKLGFKVTRQDKQSKKILTDLNSYMDWLNSCKLIITNDSLGLHLAIALKKKVLGLFGPTSHKEFYFYGRGKAILPEESLFDCRPCFNAVCPKAEICMKAISPEKVMNEVNILLNLNESNNPI